MTKLSIVGSGTLFMLGFYQTAVSQSVNQAVKSKQTTEATIQRIVCFKFKPGTSPEAIYANPMINSKSNRSRSMLTILLAEDDQFLFKESLRELKLDFTINIVDDGAKVVDSIKRRAYMEQIA